MESIVADLFALQDQEYQAFHCKLIPNIATERVIGVRTPVLRRYAKALAKQAKAADFLQELPHRYYEENNIHGFILETYQDYRQLVTELDRFLPYVDNWATCDLMSPKIFAAHKSELIEQIKQWLQSDKTYVVRFALVMLMKHYLDEAFLPEYLAMAAGVQSEEYYINMAVAWFFAEALAKQWDAAVPYIIERKLEKWTHNKAIRKAIESYRIAPERKTYLKTLVVR